MNRIVGGDRVRKAVRAFSESSEALLKSIQRAEIQVRQNPPGPRASEVAQAWKRTADLLGRICDEPINGNKDVWDMLANSISQGNREIPLATCWARTIDLGQLVRPSDAGSLILTTV
jgi:hypothetical protein